MFRLPVQINSFSAPILKDDPLRSEPYRRAVASLACIHCRIEGYSQHAHANAGKGKGLKTDDRTGFPLCCARPGVNGCHQDFDHYRLFPRSQAAEVGREWGRATRARVHGMAMWPKNLPCWPGETLNELETNK